MKLTRTLMALGAAAYGMAVLVLTTSCSPAASGTPGSVSVRPSAESPTVQSRALKGRTVTVLQKDGAIMSFAVSKIEGETIIGRDALGREVRIALEDVRHVDVTGPPCSKTVNTLCGVFAKTGEIAGKGVVYGVVYPLGSLMSGYSGGGSFGSYRSGSYSGSFGGISCPSGSYGGGSSGGISCGSSSTGSGSCGSGSGGSVSCGGGSVGGGSGASP